MDRLRRNEWSALRGSRRRTHGAGDAGPVDAALGRPGFDEPAALARARGLRGLRRARPTRAAPARGAAHAAPGPLLGVARAPLGRSGLPGRLSVVQHPALLAGPDPGAARADRADGGGTAQ